jgi:hypothetical protein
MNSGLVILNSYTLKISSASEFRIWLDDVIPCVHDGYDVIPCVHDGDDVIPCVHDVWSVDVTTTEPRHHVETGIPTLFMIFTRPFTWINYYFIN